MPTISLFYGIAIRMFYNDHAPPHFHAVFAEYEAIISIKSGEIIKGNLPRHARMLVLEWTKLYNDELLSNWERGKKDVRQPFERIPGLDQETH